jgi:hypothetical protein
MAVRGQEQVFCQRRGKGTDHHTPILPMIGGLTGVFYGDRHRDMEKGAPAFPGWGLTVIGPKNQGLVEGQALA